MEPTALDVFLKVSSFLGGSTALFFWWDRIKNRSRIKIWSIKLIAFPNKLPIISFEAENLGLVSMSIIPEIILKGYVPKNSKKKRFKYNFTSYVFTITDPLNRNMPPRTPLKFTASCNPSDNMYPFLRLNIYLISPTVGAPKIIREKSLNGKRLGILRYCYEKLIFLIFRRFIFQKELG